MRNHQNMGILGSVVPVPLCLVPVPNTFYMVVPVPLVSVPVPVRFYWVVPLPPYFGTGTTSWFCPELLLFALFGTNSPHTTSPFHNTSRTNMYHPILVPVPLRGFTQNCFFLPSLVPILLIQLLHSIIPQEPTWNSSKTTP